MIAYTPSQVKALGFQFVALPVEILRRPDLSAAAKLLAAVVMDNARSSRGGACKLTNAGLGARIGRSAASVKRLLAELGAAGLVRRETAAEGRIRLATTPTWVAQERAAGQASPAQDRATGGAGSPQGVARGCATIQSPPSDPRIQTGPDLSPSEEGKPTPAEVAAAIRGMFGRVGYSATAGAGFVRRDRRPPPCPVPRDGADLARMRAARGIGPATQGVDRGPIAATGLASLEPDGKSCQGVRLRPIPHASPDR